MIQYVLARPYVCGPTSCPPRDFVVLEHLGAKTIGRGREGQCRDCEFLGSENSFHRSYQNHRDFDGRNRF